MNRCKPGTLASKKKCSVSFSTYYSPLCSLTGSLIAMRMLPCCISKASWRAFLSALSHIPLIDCFSSSFYCSSVSMTGGPFFSASAFLPGVLVSSLCFYFLVPFVVLLCRKAPDDFARLCLVLDLLDLSLILLSWDTKLIDDCLFWLFLKPGVCESFNDNLVVICLLSVPPIRLMIRLGPALDESPPVLIFLAFLIEDIFFSKPMPIVDVFVLTVGESEIWGSCSKGGLSYQSSVSYHNYEDLIWWIFIKSSLGLLPWGRFETICKRIHCRRWSSLLWFFVSCHWNRFHFDEGSWRSCLLVLVFFVRDQSFHFCLFQ